MTFDKRIAGTLAAAALLLASCGVTKRLPEGAYLLSRNRVEIDAVEDLPRSQRLTADEAEKYIKQTPYRRFLGTDFLVWAYNRADTAKRGINRIYQRIGQPPAILDSTLTERSTQALSLFAQGRGFFHAGTDHSVDTVGRRVHVTYHLHPG
ncbi:MAG: hypothetical protein LBU80_06505, partial [Rikenellaceae bacterium]|nr:hypothetical protein [Rikenellaceae bacterium]